MYLLTIVLLASGQVIGTAITIGIMMLFLSNKKIAKRYFSWAYSISIDVVNEVLENDLERRLEEV